MRQGVEPVRVHKARKFALELSILGRARFWVVTAGGCDEDLRWWHRPVDGGLACVAGQQRAEFRGLLGGGVRQDAPQSRTTFRTEPFL